MECWPVSLSKDMAEKKHGKFCLDNAVTSLMGGKCLGDMKMVELVTLESVERDIWGKETAD